MNQTQNFPTPFVGDTTMVQSISLLLPSTVILLGLLFLLLSFILAFLLLLSFAHCLILSFSLAFFLLHDLKTTRCVQIFCTCQTIAIHHWRCPILGLTLCVHYEYDLPPRMYAYIMVKLLEQLQVASKV